MTKFLDIDQNTEEWGDVGITFCLIRKIWCNYRSKYDIDMKYSHTDIPDFGICIKFTAQKKCSKTYCNFSNFIYIYGCYFKEIERRTKKFINKTLDDL